MTQPAAPAILAHWLAPFEALFTRPTWQNLLVLGRRRSCSRPGGGTVTAALSIMDRSEAAGFTNFHRVLNRDRWSTRAVARACCSC